MPHILNIELSIGLKTGSANVFLLSAIWYRYLPIGITNAINIHKTKIICKISYPPKFKTSLDSQEHIKDILLEKLLLFQVKT